MLATLIARVNRFWMTLTVALLFILLHFVSPHSLRHPHLQKHHAPLGEVEATPLLPDNTVTLHRAKHLPTLVGHHPVGAVGSALWEHPHVEGQRTFPILWEEASQALRKTPLPP